MLGWHINVFKTNLDKFVAYDSSTNELRIASWSTGMNGIDWLKKLSQESLIQELGGNGYPYRFSAKASVIIPKINFDPLISADLIISDQCLLDEYERQTLKIDVVKISKCRANDLLLIEAWDQS